MDVSCVANIKNFLDDKKDILAKIFNLDKDKIFINVDYKYPHGHIFIKNDFAFIMYKIAISFFPGNCGIIILSNEENYVLNHEQKVELHKILIELCKCLEYSLALWTLNSEQRSQLDFLGKTGWKKIDNLSFTNRRTGNIVYLLERHL